LGRLAFQRDDWPARLAHRDRAAASPLTRKRAHILRAEVQRRRGDPSAAERERRVAEDLPVDPEAPDPVLEALEWLQGGRHSGLAQASRLLKQGRGAEAVALLGDLVGDYPDSASAWLGLGRALIQEERYRPAEQALREAARLNAERVEVSFYLGVAFFSR